MSHRWKWLNTNIAWVSVVAPCLRRWLDAWPLWTGTVISDSSPLPRRGHKSPAAPPAGRDGVHTKSTPADLQMLREPLSSAPAHLRRLGEDELGVFDQALQRHGDVNHLGFLLLLAGVWHKLSVPAVEDDQAWVVIHRVFGVRKTAAGDAKTSALKRFIAEFRTVKQPALFGLFFFSLKNRVMSVSLWWALN